MKKTILISAATCLAASATLLAGPARDIAAKHSAASATELEAYVTKNPEAEDKREAIDLLLRDYGFTGNKERMHELMEVKFDMIEGGPDTNSRELYMSALALFQSHLSKDDKEGAKKIFDEAIEKSKDNKNAAELAAAFAQMKLQLNTPIVGETMEIKFTSLGGEEVDLDAMKDKVVLVDFWATWCKPCIAELPHVQETYAKYHEQGFEVVSISIDKDVAKLEKFLEANEMPWPQGSDKSGAISSKYGIISIPATFLIGKDGKVVATKLRGDALEKAVAKALGGE